MLIKNISYDKKCYLRFPYIYIYNLSDRKIQIMQQGITLQQLLQFQDKILHYLLNLQHYSRSKILIITKNIPKVSYFCMFLIHKTLLILIRAADNLIISSDIQTQNPCLVYESLLLLYLYYYQQSQYFRQCLYQAYTFLAEHPVLRSQSLKDYYLKTSINRVLKNERNAFPCQHCKTIKLFGVITQKIIFLNKRTIEKLQNYLSTHQTPFPFKLELKFQANKTQRIIKCLSYSLSPIQQFDLTLVLQQYIILIKQILYIPRSSEKVRNNLSDFWRRHELTTSFQQITSQTSLKFLNPTTIIIHHKISTISAQKQFYYEVL
eukprot:TRINITY_DN3242_c0_g3_i8.p1 TRINITY_DN3242_c0_g3~~TRINITY_DN3242_c0_g3_i8.p1  ORF type:complete len:320 (+),score=-30.68 TRINITY_DN3242_c0_g3_i8:163-1122(+)